MEVISLHAVDGNTCLHLFQDFLHYLVLGISSSSIEPVLWKASTKAGWLFRFLPGNALQWRGWPLQPGLLLNYWGGGSSQRCQRWKPGPSRHLKYPLLHAFRSCFTARIQGTEKLQESESPGRKQRLGQLLQLVGATLDGTKEAWLNVSYTAKVKGIRRWQILNRHKHQGPFGCEGHRKGGPDLPFSFVRQEFKFL